MIQLFILLLSGISIFLITLKNKPYSKYGYIIGLFSQPFWLYDSYIHEQYGIFLLSIFYTYSWGQGIYFHFIETK